MLCDLPGYGFAKVPVALRESWRKMVGDYLERRDSLLALVVIVDVRRGFEEDDLQLVEACAGLSLQPILVATKCDKLSRNELFNRQGAICRAVGADVRDIVWFSSESGKGRDELWARIGGLTSTSTADAPT